MIHHRIIAGTCVVVAQLLDPKKLLTMAAAAGWVQTDKRCLRV